MRSGRSSDDPVVPEEVGEHVDVTHCAGQDPDSPVDASSEHGEGAGEEHVTQQTQGLHLAGAREQAVLIEEHAFRVPETVPGVPPVADAEPREHEVIEVDQYAESQAVARERCPLARGVAIVDRRKHQADHREAEEEVFT